MWPLIGPIFSTMLYNRKIVQVQLQEIYVSVNKKNTLCFYRPLHKLGYNKSKLILWQFNDRCNSLYKIEANNKISNNVQTQFSKTTASIIWKQNWKKCEGLQEIKHFDRYSSNSKYEFRNQGTRFRMHEIVHFDCSKFSSDSKVNGAQPNSKGSDDENAKKLTKDAEDKAKRMKVIDDDHAQTIAQLLILKAQVKKVHEEMQVRKYESWTIKVGKIISSIGNFFTKIIPTIGRILSMSR